MRPTHVDRLKKESGFLYGNQRPACQNCAHVHEVSPTGAANDRWALRCEKQGFGVTALAICDWHEPKPVGRSV